MICSIWIALAHAFHAFRVTDAAALWIKQTSFIATDSFIIMSAVSLSLGYGARIEPTWSSWSRFMVRRLVRIWPIHALLLVFMAASQPFGLAPGSASHTSDQVWAWLCQLMLIQAWGINSDWSLWNSPTWTLSALTVCYAIFPFIGQMAGYIRRPRALLAVAVALYGGVWCITDQLNLSGFGGLLALPQQFGVLRAVPIFVLTILAVPVLRPLPLVPHAAGLELFAKNSYCVYVVHWPILKAMELLQWQGWASAVLSLFIIFAAGHVLRKHVDDPIQQVLRQRLR